MRKIRPDYLQPQPFSFELLAVLEEDSEADFLFELFSLFILHTPYMIKLGFHVSKTIRI